MQQYPAAAALDSDQATNDPSSTPSAQKTPRRTLRVLMIAPSLQIVGGHSVQANELLAGLRRDGSIDVDFLPIDTAFPRPLRWIRSIRYVRTAVNALYYLALLLLRMPRADVVHVFAASYYSFLWAPAPALILGRILGIPTVLNYHDGRAAGHLSEWRSTKPLARLATRIVTPSEYLVDVFGRFGLPAEAIFNMVDMKRYRRRERAPLRPVFLHNRAMDPLYNVPCALRAFQIIQRERPDASLVLAHDGPLRRELEQMAADLGLRSVRFIGVVPQSRMPELYDDADIYLTTPDIDNMPLSILECYASGVPVVATTAGGIPYIARDGETALLADCNDHEGVARAALRLLNDPDLALRLTRNAHAECSRYAWDSVRDRWLRLYGSVASRNAVS